MNAALTNKQGIVFDTINVDTKEEAIKWAKNRGNCHLMIGTNSVHYLDYKIICNKAHHMTV